MGNDKFFNHFIVASLLILVLAVFFLTGIVIVGLWEAGVTIFIVVFGLLWTFGWIVHKLASSEAVQHWLKSL